METLTRGPLTLITKAVDNHGFVYPVILTECPNKDRKHDFVLRIEGAGGSWYMTSLEERPRGDRIAIDFGQNWYCTNFGAIMTEARRLLEGLDRLTANDAKAEDDSVMTKLVASFK